MYLSVMQYNILCCILIDTYSQQIPNDDDRIPNIDKQPEHHHQHTTFK